MTFLQRIRVRNGRAVCVGVALLLAVAGCQQDDIRRYRVAKTAHPKRLLAAMVPHGERTWFFKLVGAPDQVAAHKAEFDGFLKSVRFPAGSEPPVEWTVPEDWRAEGKKSDLRYATFRIGPSNGSLELTVVALGREAGSVLANVNRWREQLSLPPLSSDQLDEKIKHETIAGESAILVDINSADREPVTGVRPPQPAPRASSDVAYQLPDGWEEQRGSGGFRKAAFVVKDGDQKAEITVIPLAGIAGGAVQNVQRWRGQVGLEPGSDEQVKKEMESIEVAGDKRPYVDLVGPDSAGGKRTLGVIVELPGKTWFITMKGPRDLVGKQKSAFEAFVRSLKFEAR